jgi:hypothetical protein
MLSTVISNHEIEISIKKVTSKQIYAPKIELLYEVYKLFLHLNFNSNLEFWTRFGNAEMLHTDFPIYVSTKNNKEFEIVGGFRTYQILNMLNKEFVDVIDVSKASEQQLKTLCLQTTVLPILIWSSTDIHSKSHIKSFLKEIERIFPELKTIIPSGGNYSKSVSRHLGRKRKVQLSKLSIKIANKLKSLGEINGGK